MNLVDRARHHRMPLLCALALAACSGATDLTAPPSSGRPAALTIVPQTATLTVGASTPLQAEVRDASGKLVSGASVFWASSDTSVAQVSAAGVVSARKVGGAQIAASAMGNSAVATVTVVPVPVASVTVVPSTGSISVGGTLALRAITYDASGNALSGRAVAWASSAPQVATVDDNGTATGRSAGTATITATSEGKTGSAQVTVTAIPTSPPPQTPPPQNPPPNNPGGVAQVMVTPTYFTVDQGSSKTLTARVYDAQGNELSGYTITWQSADTQIATVSPTSSNNARARGVGVGATTITASAGGKQGTAAVYVKKDD